MVSRLGLSAGAADASRIQVSYAGGVLNDWTVARYDDVNMDSDVSCISMSINNGSSRNSYQYNNFNPKSIQIP